MLFQYSALDTEGNRKTGKIDASDKNMAKQALERRDLVVTSVYRAKEQEVNSLLNMNITFFERVSTKDVVIVSRQMATLFQAQVSALRIFRLLSTEVDNPKLGRIMNQIAEDLQAGSNISDALAKHPDVFSNFYVAMVKSGEETGKLDETFGYLADYLDRMYQVSTKAKNALIYPSFVVLIFIFVVGLIFTVIIPSIAPILEDSGQDLPIYTEIVLGVSSFFASYWLFILVSLSICGILGWKYIQTKQGKLVWDRFKIDIPYIGTLIQQLFLARMADNLNTMFASGISMVRGLEITRNIIDNEVYKEILDDAIESVRGGSNLSAVFAEYDEIPGIFVQMIKVGEETGELSSLLDTLAKFYEREVENSVDTLVGMIEPIMIVVLGLGVGVLLASVLMPIYNLASGF